MVYKEKMVNNIKYFMCSLFPNNKSKQLPYIIVILISISLSAFWHLSNNAYPRNDEAHYAGIALNLYHDFQEEGTIQGMINIYQKRIFKIVLLPVFALPSMFLTAGNTLRSIAITACSFFLIFITYLYLLFRHYYSRQISAISTLFISTIPWVINTSHGFNNEITFLAFSLATLYHVIKSNFFSHKAHSIFFAIFFALSICIRPVLSIIFYFPPLLLFLHHTYTKKYLRKNDFVVSIFLLTLLVICCSTLFIYHEFILNSHLIIIFIIWSLILIGINIFHRSLNLNSRYLGAFSIASTLPFFWYGPYIKPLYNNAVDSTYSFHLNPGNNYFSFLFTMLLNVGGWPLLILLVLILLKTLLIRKLNILKNIAFINFFLLAAFLINITLLSYSITYSRDMRYMFLPAIILFISIIFFLFNYSSKKNYWTNYVALGSLSLFHIIALVIVLIDNTQQLPKIFVKTVGFPYAMTSQVYPYKRTDPFLEVMSEIKNRHQDNSLLKILYLDTSKVAPYNCMNIDPLGAYTGNIIAKTKKVRSLNYHIKNHYQLLRHINSADFVAVTELKHTEYPFAFIWKKILSNLNKSNFGNNNFSLVKKIAIKNFYTANGNIFLFKRK